MEETKNPNKYYLQKKIFVSHISFLSRLPCLIHCDMFPICKERGPVNEIGREIDPTTLQNQVHASRNSLVKRFGQISDLPPDYIRELVKGLSTQEIIQVAYLYYFFFSFISFLFSETILAKQGKNRFSINED